MRSETQEIPVCGYNAAIALLERHPERVRRLFFNPPAGKRLGPYCRALAREKKIYRQVEDEELARIAGTVHHGGVVAIMEAPRLRQPSEREVAAWSDRGEPLLLLDRIGNAHNLGALVRSAAFFGFPRLVLGDARGQAMPGAAAWRIAEGGMEHVELFVVRDLAGFCRQIRGNYRVMATALEKAAPLPTQEEARQWPKPPALVLGNEEEGISPLVRKACQDVVRIPGGGAIESLNVGAAGAVLMYWLCHATGRQRLKG
jgi:RNA methyltransferase, TrmH family